MRILKIVLTGLLLIAAGRVYAITADELIAKNIEARGGLEKMRAIQSLRMTGKMRFGDGALGDFNFTLLSKRAESLRTEISRQGLTAITAYDGTTGWAVRPFFGRKDPEKLSADDIKQLKIQADIDGPLVDYKTKGNKVEYLGTEDVDGTEAHKLRVTMKSGDVQYIYLDPDFFLEIRTLDQITIRGTQEVTETDIGDYEQVNGVYFPFSIESGSKGGPRFQRITIDKGEANVELENSIFQFPSAAAPAK